MIFQSAICVTIVYPKNTLFLIWVQLVYSFIILNRLICSLDQTYNIEIALSCPRMRMQLELKESR